MYRKVASMFIDQQAMKDNLSRRGRFSNWIRVTLQEQVPGGNQEEEKLDGLNDEDFTWLLEIRAKVHSSFEEVDEVVEVIDNEEDPIPMAVDEMEPLTIAATKYKVTLPKGMQQQLM